MIRVLHVMTRMAPGGTEVQLLGMLKAAHQKHWDATLCVLSDGWPLTDEVASAGIPVITLSGTTRFDPRRPLAFRKLARNFDVVHSSLPGANAFTRISTIARTQPAIVVSERGVDDLRTPTRRVADRVLAGSTDAYIGNSTDVTDFIRSAHRIDAQDPRVFEVGNGMDLDTFTPATRQTPGQRPRLIMASRLVASKRVDMAIEVFRKLTNTADVEMVIVGDGPERDSLERQAAGLSITFLGHVSDRKALAESLRLADVFLMTSATEGLPNALLEALASGVPVVAANVPGIRSAAGPGVTLVDGSPDAWCHAILDAIRQGKPGVSLVGDRVSSFDAVAVRHLEVFNWALERSQDFGQKRRHQLGHPTSSEVLWPIQSTLADD